MTLQRNIKKQKYENATFILVNRFNMEKLFHHFFIECSFSKSQSTKVANNKLSCAYAFDSNIFCFSTCI